METRPCNARKVATRRKVGYRLGVVFVWKGKGSVGGIRWIEAKGKQWEVGLVGVWQESGMVASRVRGTWPSEKGGGKKEPALASRGKIRQQRGV